MALDANYMHTANNTVTAGHNRYHCKPKLVQFVTHSTRTRLAGDELKPALGVQFVTHSPGTRLGGDELKPPLQTFSALTQRN